jgi:hypothetical protein
MKKSQIKNKYLLSNMKKATSFFLLQIFQTIFIFLFVSHSVLYGKHDTSKQKNPTQARALLGQSNMGTDRPMDGPMDGPMDQPTDEVYCRGACSRLKRYKILVKQAN